MAYGLTVSLLAVSQLVVSVVLPVNCGLVAIEKPHIVFESYLVSGSITLLLGLPLVWVYGVNGTAAALIATGIGGAGFRFWSFWFRTRNPSESG